MKKPLRMPHFLGEQFSIEKARFLVLPVPYERTTSYKKGTNQGPKALLDASYQLELYDEELDRETWLKGIHTFPMVISSQSQEKFFPKLTSYVEEIAGMKEKTIFVIGGEHSLTQAIVPAYLKHYPNLSVLHFDAHTDLRSEYEGTPHSHACALYPASLICKVVQVGTRSIGLEELPNTAHGNVTTFKMQKNLDVAKLIPKVLDALTKDVYVSIDVDGFDPSVIPGVGTPEPGGFSWYDGLALFRAIFERKNIVGVDVMELCPLHDTNISEFTAAKLVYRLMGYLVC
jgi:agmatinase